MYWLMTLISILKIGSRQQEASRPSDATSELDPALHSRRAARHRRSPLLSANLRQSHVDQTPAHGVYHVAGGAERQTSVDFRQGVLGMPLAFEQTPPAPPVPTCLREAQDTRLAHGANNIADEHLADAIEPPSRKPAAAGKK